jgi:hypothetical protein
MISSSMIGSSMIGSSMIDVLSLLNARVVVPETVVAELSDPRTPATVRGRIAGRLGRVHPREMGGSAAL